MKFFKTLKSHLFAIVMDWVTMRGVFGYLPSTYDEAFCENSVSVKYSQNIMDGYKWLSPEYASAHGKQTCSKDSMKKWSNV